MRYANLLKGAAGSVKRAMHKNGKRIGVIFCCLAIMVMSVVSCFAETPNATEAVAAATTVLGSVTAVLNITNVAAILAACMGSATLLFLAWWGVRKVTRVTVNAFAKGKLSI